MDIQQPALEEVVEGPLEVLGCGMGQLRDHAAEQVVAAAGQYVSAYN